MRNLEIAEILYEIADYLDMDQIEFKPRAYRRAAQTVESLSEDIAEIAKKQKLEDLPGIGESIAEKINEYIKTGKIKYYEELKKKIPVRIKELIGVEGIGPKTVKLLYTKLKIKSLKELVQAAKEGKIHNIKNLGEKTEKHIIERSKVIGKRYMLGIVMPEAESIKKLLLNRKEVLKVEIGGSLRRQKETIGDIDLLAISKKPSETRDFFVKIKSAGVEVKEVLAKGITKSAIILKNGIQVDLRIIEDKSWGSALLYFTGNKSHNIKMREICIKRGYKLNEYGLFDKQKMIAGKTEKEVFNKIGMQYIPPEIRQNNGEIELALKKKIPKLVEYKDILGDLHMHTNNTDGVNTILEMVNYAENLGRKYICITDHVNLKIANGLDEKRIIKYIDDIRKINKKTNIEVFAGAEINILKDGNLDMCEKILKKLDIVIGGVHSNFRMNKKMMTNRILKAMDNGIDILAHPTGKLLNKRFEYELDKDKVFQKAKDNDIVLEIDGQPTRLDLNGNDVKEAIKFGCLIATNSDAHSIDQQNYVKYAVGMARRGWATKKDIINTYNLSKIKKFFNI